MGTTIRPELSERNKYWIERHRYYELKHFCLQYPVWKRTHAALGLLGTSGIIQTSSSKTNTISDPVGNCAEARSYYAQRMDMVEDTAIFAAGELSSYILKGVTVGVSYEHLKARLEIPCCKDVYYELYRRFFWLLDKARN